MFVGHYGAAYFAKGAEKRVPLGIFFLAVQLVDILSALFILIGIERVRIVHGTTAANPLDFTYFPFTHGLTGVLAWSVIAGFAYWFWRRRDGVAPALWVGAAVLSHWPLDLIVHEHDLPLVGNAFKVGFGLWNHPMDAFLAEALVLLLGLWYYVRRTKPIGPAGRYGAVVFTAILLAVQLASAFGPPPTSVHAVAAAALLAYFLFALIAWRLDRARVVE